MIDMIELKSHYGNFEGYKAGVDGNIYSVSHNWRGKGVRALKGQKSEHGYLRVYLKESKGKSRRLPVHVLICSSFHGVKPSESHEVRHLDGNKENNTPNNLAWGTRSENAFDRSSHGIKVGRYGNNQKLTEDIVKLIITSKESNRSLAKKYGVTDTTIRYIKQGKTWKNIYKALAKARGEV